MACSVYMFVSKPQLDNEYGFFFTNHSLLDSSLLMFVYV